MSDALWEKFGCRANIPESELKRIRDQMTSDRERKQAVVQSIISSHPAPSWTLVAWALYLTGSSEKYDNCLRAFDRLQHMFPVGEFIHLMY